jgi:Mg2+-importing ATPase
MSSSAAIDADGDDSAAVLRLGLSCNDADPREDAAVGGNPLDRALWAAPGAADTRVGEVTRVASLPFDHDRRLMSVLVDGLDDGRTLVCKGAPESILERCTNVPDAARDQLGQLFADGRRVVAVATRPGPGMTSLDPADEAGLTFAGLLVFLDPPYAMLSEPRDVDRLRELFKAILPVMEESGTLVLRTQEFAEISPHEGWDGPVTYKYGSMNVSFYTKPGAPIAEG